MEGIGKAAVDRCCWREWRRIVGNRILGSRSRVINVGSRGGIASLPFDMFHVIQNIVSEA